MLFLVYTRISWGCDEQTKIDIVNVDNEEIAEKIVRKNNEKEITEMYELVSVRELKIKE